LISVIIPALNEEQSIHHTLASLRAQDLDPTEFNTIVVDGGSTDGTSRIVRSYGAKLIIADGAGIARSQNIGFRATRADIVVFTQADTIMPPDWLRKIRNEFARDENLIALTGPVEPAGGPIWFQIEYAAWNFIRWFTSLFPLPLGMFFTSGPNIAVRSWAFEKIGGFDEFMPAHEDGTLGKMLKKLGKVKFAGPLFLPIYVTISPRRSKLGFRGMHRYYMFMIGDLFPFNVILPKRIWKSIRIRTWMEMLRVRSLSESEVARRIAVLEKRP